MGNLKAELKQNKPFESLEEEVFINIIRTAELLDRLEARGFITRDREQKDRRVITVKITKEGLVILKRIDQPILSLTKELLGHLDEKKLKTLNELIENAREKSQ
jgi:DNA-binding MarR family transcriptional regulator